MGAAGDFLQFRRVVWQTLPRPLSPEPSSAEEASAPTGPAEESE